MRAFSRYKDHREHMMRNLATSLILFESIDTTEAKAKELKSFVDHIIAQGKKADLSARRNLNKVFFDKKAVEKILDVLVPRYAERSSGFTRSFHLRNRLGDNSSMMRVELIDKKVFIEDKKETVPAEKSAKKTVKQTEKNDDK